MGTLDLRCRIRKVRYRLYRGEVGKIASNVLKRDFRASLPNQKWTTDITQINIEDENLQKI